MSSIGRTSITYAFSTQMWVNGQLLKKAVTTAAEKKERTSSLKLDQSNASLEIIKLMGHNEKII